MSGENIQRISLGRGLYLAINKDITTKVAQLYREGTFIKVVDLSDKVARKLFVTEVIELGAKKSYLSDALGISRQTIHNYLQTKKHFGLEGLIQGYTVSDSKDVHKQRKINEKKRPSGNKSIQLAEIRKREKQEEAEKKPHQVPLNLSFNEEEIASVVPEEQPFAENHDWKPCRYAGCFIYWPILIDKWNWLQLVVKNYGDKWSIFTVFMFMSALNIRSIEQLKNTRLREARIVLGLKYLPTKKKVWEYFYGAANLNRASILLEEYFRHQIKSGAVGLWLWFSDGHLLPYTGKENIHYSYSTQRQRAVPGRTNQVVCDEHGRIVDFTIQEGKGQMKEVILSTTEKWMPDLHDRPVAVFDREGYDAGFFWRLTQAKQPFVTWDKNVDKSKLSELDDALFSTEFTFNNKDYAIFEKEKAFSYKEPSESPDKDTIHEVNLRHIYIWNKKSNRRTCGLAFTEPSEMSLEECAKAILSRWGASENTFKHIYERHPFHYHPGFKFVESEKQDISNPEIKKTETMIQSIKKSLDKLYKKLSKVNQIIRKDGESRVNSAYDKIKKNIQHQEEELRQQQEAKKELPERIDVSGLENYDSFKNIHNEGKYLFDFVTTSVWNARKQMCDWLAGYYNQENDVVDLFYAITYCQGWVKSTIDEVTVRLEPLQQRNRRAAQECLCRKLTSLGAQMPNGKRLVVEVGERPNGCIFP